MSCRSRRQRTASIVATLFLSACHPSPRTAQPSAPDPLPALQHDIDAAIDRPDLARSYWGVLVRSLDRDETLYARNSGRLFIPASNMKIVTAAVTAARLGWDYRYETRLVAHGSISDGVLRGDLVVVGSGDPSIGERNGSDARLFDQWAQDLGRRGIRRIDGRILADASLFDAEALGFGWSWDDLEEDYAAGVSAVQFNENRIRITVGPGPRAGDSGAASISPPGSGVVIDNLVTTSPAGTEPSIQMRRPAADDRLRLTGSVPLGSSPLTLHASVDDPARYLEGSLRNALVSHGIDVRGGISTDRADARTQGADAQVVGRYLSPPLSDLASTLMKVSQNLYAETFIKTLGASGSTGSSAGGIKIVEETLKSWGIADSDLIMRDGSGLSRYDYVTPDALVRILTHVFGDDRLRDAFDRTLPIAGVDGSLSRRMKGTAAEGNAHAKTGSMSNVRSLSGYVHTAEGERLVFSIIANNFDTTAESIDAATDSIVVRLATFSRRGAR